MMDEIICVLDCSGSMGVVSGAAVEGYNQFLSEQQQLGDAHLTVINFSNDAIVEYDGELRRAHNLDHWRVGGMTALFDGIGMAFSHVKERFSKEKPENVILAIMTDGYENASKEYKRMDIANLIKEHQDKYNWNVIFMAADQDAWLAAKDLNIPQANAVSYRSVDTVAAYGSLSSATAACRS